MIREMDTAREMWIYCRGVDGTPNEMVTFKMKETTGEIILEDYKQADNEKSGRVYMRKG